MLRKCKIYNSLTLVHFSENDYSKRQFFTLPESKLKLW